MVGEGAPAWGNYGMLGKQPSEQAVAPLLAAGLDQGPAHHAPGLAASFVRFDWTHLCSLTHHLWQLPQATARTEKLYYLAPG